MACSMPAWSWKCHRQWNATSSQVRRTSTTDHEYDLRMDASSNQSLALVRLCHQQTTGSCGRPLNQSNGWRYSRILHQNTCNSRPPENCDMDLQLETRVDDRSYYDLRMDDNDTAYMFNVCRGLLCGRSAIGINLLS